MIKLSLTSNLAFVRDLLVNPLSREVRDVNHQVAAVAASNSSQRAIQFIDRLGIPKENIKAYGSYKELVDDPSVQIIYIATPHSHHFQNAMLALTAGKHVLCEKPLTITAAQTQKLISVAKENKVFLMEAMWTRILPILRRVKEICASGKIGTISHVTGE